MIVADAGSGWRLSVDTAGREGHCDEMDDAEIQRLISTPKRIAEAPSKDWRNDLAQKRKDFRLVSSDGAESFRAFARQSLVWPENFSIGLEFEPKDGSDCIILIRCNGPHGDYNRAAKPDHPHFHCHVHLATEAAISQGLRPESAAKESDKFASVKEAMRFFLETVNLNREEQDRYFADDVMPSLFELPENTNDAP
jgi:hypothetical protein